MVDSLGKCLDDSYRLLGEDLGYTSEKNPWEFSPGFAVALFLEKLTKYSWETSPLADS